MFNFKSKKAFNTIFFEFTVIIRTYNHLNVDKNRIQLTRISCTNYFP